jgi:serine phosphatase RsbU (regulator of sigma subunit)
VKWLAISTTASPWPVIAICCVWVMDGSGKGMPAALLMSTCLSLLRAYAEVLDSPSAIMRRLNRRLCHNNPTYAFTTLVRAVLDSRNGELSYCNAGHNPSLLKRRDGPVESLGQVHGPALGVEVQSGPASFRPCAHAGLFPKQSAHLQQKAGPTVPESPA